MIKDPVVQEAAQELQEVMMDMLRRRAVFEALEERAVGKVAQDNEILRLLASDYLRSQLSDLRKFFETNGRSHRASDLTAKLPTGSKVQQTHKSLFARWKSQFEPVANQYMLHRQKGYVPPPGTSRGDLDHFINDIGLFLDGLIGELVAANYDVAHVSREISYFQQIKADAHELFAAL